MQIPSLAGRALSALAVAATVGVFTLAAGAGPAAAEGRIRIAEQFGIGYLPLHVIRHDHLIEKHGRELGFDIAVDWAQLSSGAAMNDALLSDSIDVGAGGVGPMLTIWDRTKGAANVRAIAALNDMPLFLTTNNPNVRSLKDFTDKDKIALPAVKVSVQARTLQMAAEAAFGSGKFDVLDRLTVSLSHPDAAAALLSGKTEITAHFTSPPFQYQELKDPRVHTVLSSYDVLGGPHTFNLVWAKQSFRDANPKTFQAFFAALKEAMDIINRDHAAAAAAYLAVNKGDLDKAAVEGILNDPDIRFSVAPRKIGVYAAFMHKVGAIRNLPATWKDCFFTDLDGESGS